MDRPDGTGKRRGFFGSAGCDSHQLTTLAMKCELVQEHTDGPFMAALFLQKGRWRNEDCGPDIDETKVCELEVQPSTSDVMSAVENWLCNAHHLSTMRSGWAVAEVNEDTGVVALLSAYLTICPETDRGMGRLCGCERTWLSAVGNAVGH